MVVFPILEELKNFLYTNLESLLLVVVPLATLIGWLSERNNKRLHAMEETGAQLIKGLKDEIDKRDIRMAEFERDYNDFKVRMSKDVGILRALYAKGFDVDESDRDHNYDVYKKRRRSNRND